MNTNNSSPADRVPYAAMIPIAERVVALVQANPDGLGRSEIARAIGVPPATVGSALSRAVADGVIERLGRGTYAPTTTTAEATTSRETASDRRETASQQRAGIRIRLGRMGQQEGLLIAAGGGYGEAFVPREALPDLRRRLARAQAKFEA